MQLCVARHLLPDARLSCNAEQIAQVGRTAVLRPLNPQQNRNDIITIHPDAFSASGKTFSEGKTMKMAITAGKALAITLATLLTGCGLTQKVTDGTVAVTKSIFYRQVKTLHWIFRRAKG